MKVATNPSSLVTALTSKVSNLTIRVGPTQDTSDLNSTMPSFRTVVPEKSHGAIVSNWWKMMWSEQGAWSLLDERIQPQIG